MYRSELVAASSRSTDVLSLPDAGAGERVSIQPLPDSQAAHRDRARALPHRAPDQDLVPEPPHEGQKGEDADPGAERHGEVGVVMATAATAAARCHGEARTSAARQHSNRFCGKDRSRPLTTSEIHVLVIAL